MKKTIIPIILTAAFLYCGRVYAHSSFEYTPVIPRINAYRMNIEDNRLEKYTDKTYRPIPKVSREDKIDNMMKETNDTQNSQIKNFQNGTNKASSSPRGKISRNLGAPKPETLDNETDIGESNIENNNESNKYVDNHTWAQRYNDSANISNDLTAKTEYINTIEEVNNYKVTGGLPQIANIANAPFAEQINTKIKDSFLYLVNAGYRNVSVDYDVHNWANITSILIRYQIGGEREIVKTFVFDSISQSEVTLRNLLGKDYVEYVNRFVSDKLAKSETGTYYAGGNKFQSIRSNQSFYVADGQIFIIFDQGLIGPATTGTPEFSIPLESLDIKLSSKDYIYKNDVLFLSVSLAARLGMKLNLKEGGILEISSFNGEKTKTINVNNEMVKSSEVIYINGYDIGLSEDIFSNDLGIIVEQDEASNEIIASYIF